MIRWNKDDPLHREIMDAAKEAFIERYALQWQTELEQLRRLLPWWARIYISVRGWLGGL